MKAIKNNYHYVLNGTVKVREGVDFVNPIFKIKSKTDNTTVDNPIVFNEYDVYPSVEVYNNSIAKDGAFQPTRIVKTVNEKDVVQNNFSSNLADLQIDLQLSLSQQQQLTMLADFLGVDDSDVTLVLENV